MTLTRPRPAMIRLNGHKRVIEARAHARADLGEGVFEAVTSAFDVEFTEGGLFKTRQIVIEKGAFTDSLSDKPTAPVMWHHNWGIGPIGQSTEESESEQGLHVIGELYLEEELPRRVWRSMKPKEEGGLGSVHEWSIGFWLEESWVEERESEDDDEDLEPLHHYTKIDRAEHSVVLRGANPDTETISVNTAGVAVTGHGAAVDAPCTMPSEFILAGRRYVADDPVVTPPSAASQLPADITFAGVRYRAAEPDPPEVPAMVSGAERLLARPEIREAFAPKPH